MATITEALNNCIDYIATVTEAYKKYTSYFVILVTVNNIVVLRYCKGTKSVRYQRLLQKNNNSPTVT